MNREQIAQVAHEINRAFCAGMGDDSQPAWADAPDWQKASALVGVDMHLANPDATPENSHESWLAQKTADGWKYGKVKDAEKKEHPCFRPYDKLPKEQKAKDYLFRAVVHQLKDLAGAVSTVTLPPPGLLSVRYIGKRPEYVDGLYGTRIHWFQGESKLVPQIIANKLLSHPDQYEPGDTEAEVALIPADSRAKEDETQEIRDQIANMGKDALGLLVKTHFGVDLDKRHTEQTLREQAVQLVDRFGAVTA